MVQKLSIGDFLERAQSLPVVDVRSPGEYGQAHIPGALSMPLFTDDERKIVGTTYKQQSREKAIKIGLDFFGPKMRPIVEQVEAIVANKRSGGNTDSHSKGALLVHCWRGGMRSGAIAWLLDLYGFKVYTLAGGYKAFRNWTLSQFAIPYPIRIVGGYTGSGKTYVLQSMGESGIPIIDLEALAHHRGSAFGDRAEPQPRQEMFENLLAMELWRVNRDRKRGTFIWLEDESQRIGSVNIPHTLWATMRSSPVCFLDIPFESRLDHIVNEYRPLPLQQLVDATARIQKRLGGLDTKNTVAYLEQANYREAFRILLSYYDKEYSKGLAKRMEGGCAIAHYDCNSVDPSNFKRFAELEIPATL